MSLLYDASLIITPTACKESKLYALKPQSGNGDLTWTRNSGATRVNSAGLIENVPYNLVSWSEQFDNASWGKLNASIVADSITSPYGTTTADTITGDGLLNFHLAQKAYVLGANNYSVSVYAKAGTAQFMQISFSGTNSIYANFDILNGVVGNLGAGSSSIESVGNGWFRCIYNILSANASFATAVNVGGIITSLTSVRAELNTSTDYLYIWGAQLTEGSTPKDYLPTTTRLNIPRLDYSLGGCPSILLEPQRTNLVLRSEQFEDAVWSKTNTTVNSNTSISPNGLMNADKLNLIGNTTNHYLSTNYTYVSGNSYTWSIYVKKEETDSISLFLNNTAIFSNNQPQNFNLTTGIFTVNGSNISGGIVNCGNGWYRCYITATALGSGSAQVRYIFTSPDSNNYNNAISIWGAQLEQGAYPTSYIPTVASTVTRVADTASKTGISSLINSEEGTLFIDQKYLSNLGIKRFGLFGTSIDDRIVFSTSDNTSNVAVFIFINGVNKYAYTYISSDILAWHKFALKWKNGEVKLFVDGLLLNTSLTFTTFPANTLNNISLNAGGINNFEGNIKSIQVYKTALTDTKLQTLTTL